MKCRILYHLTMKLPIAFKQDYELSSKIWKVYNRPMTNHEPNDPALAAAYDHFDDDIRPHLLALRLLIFETAASIAGCGEVVESLKWQQPSYATIHPKSGTPIRLGAPKSAPGRYAIYVPCQTTLIETARLTFGDEFQFEGNRALIMSTDTTHSNDAIRHFLAMALMYTRNTQKPHKKRPVPV